MIKPPQPPIPQPKSILFVCTHNMIRSPMAEALMRRRSPQTVMIDSCGISPITADGGITDGFTMRVMRELGLDISGHTPKSLDAVAEYPWDWVICFSAESYAVAQAQITDEATRVEHWPVYDPALVSENQEYRLAAYRAVRDAIAVRLDSFVWD